jgi:hypothetical protein
VNLVPIYDLAAVDDADPFVVVVVVVFVVVVAVSVFLLPDDAHAKVPSKIDILRNPLVAV